MQASVGALRKVRTRQWLAAARGLVGQLAADLDGLRVEFGLPEIDLDEHGWIDGEGEAA